jgi:hypothetical protein
MILKGIVDEDFVQYKKPCMTLMFPRCSFKCEQRLKEKICQNSSLALSPDIEVNTYDVVKRFFNSKISKVLCCSGLEPFDSPEDLNKLITLLRFCDYENEIIIYTGYTEEEVIENFSWIFAHKNLIIKFGRFIPNSEHIFDEILGVELMSNNQYAKHIN